MGKKDKTKKKVSGQVKTAIKTEKKMQAKHKKELATIGEDDIEKIVTDIEREEARRQRVIETVIGKPTRRVNFTISTHPFKNELILFGGEFYDGQKNTVYNDLFFYNISKKEWTIVKAPGTPPPRCGHQAAVAPIGKGDLWIFGGEFSSQTESQFYHYRDLWVYHLGEKKWEKIIAPGGPSARSGHRMVYMKKQLFIFGGFYDNLRDYKYFNDIHIFNISHFTWTKLEISGNPPAPRSGCIVLPTSDNKLLVYGGYSKERIKKDLDRGHVHTDMFLFSPEKTDVTGTKWKWLPVKQSGIKLSPRCSSSAILIRPNIAYVFGGVFDQEVSEEECYGTFYNDLVALNLDKYQWQTVTLNSRSGTNEKKKRRKTKGDTEEFEMDHNDCSDNDSEDKNDDQGKMDDCPIENVCTDDGIFTVTVGPSLSTRNLENSEITKETAFTPSPRSNPGLAVKENILYLYGGIFEDGNKQYTLNDFYSLDLKRLEKWDTIIEDDLHSQEWLDSSSSDSESSESEDSDEERDDDKMDVETE